MDSAPPPTATSASPSMIICEAETIACSPLPHRRLTVSAVESSGSPPLSAATREKYMSLRLGVDHVADDARADFLGIDLGALHRFAYHLRRQLGRGDVLQRAAVVADRRPHAGKHHYFAFACHVLLLNCLIGMSLYRMRHLEIVALGSRSLRSKDGDVEK